MSKKMWIVCWRGYGGIWLRIRRGGGKEYDKLTPPLWKESKIKKKKRKIYYCLIILQV